VFGKNPGTEKQLTASSSSTGFSLARKNQHAYATICERTPTRRDLNLKKQSSTFWKEKTEAISMLYNHAMVFELR